MISKVSFNAFRSGAPPITQQASSTDKITFFKSLFRGREDVYSRRFENLKTGRSGFASVCANEWIRGVCEKPRVQCRHCPNRQFLPVTDKAIGWHLSGGNDRGHDFVMGVYPVLQDETCCFLVIDFDRIEWLKDAAAFLETCHRLEIPVALERSRTGNGGHVWLFFEEAIPACLARNLGSHLLTLTMESRPDIGMRSYDRLYPNQDTLPKNGLGCLIELPLQKAARERDNTIFLDTQFNPHPDQWAFLSSVSRISRDQAEAQVRRAARGGGILGVRSVLSETEMLDTQRLAPAFRHRKVPIHGVLPERLDLVLGNQIYISQETAAIFFSLKFEG